jgi:hypothetical protein
MKKAVLLLFCIVFAVSAFAFEQGTKTLGGWIGFESYKMDSDSDPVTAIEIMPRGGYFVIDNVCVDVLVNYTTVNSKDWDDPVTELGLGLGGRYFFNTLYGGAGFMMQSHTDSWEEYSANYLVFYGGFLYPLVTNIYLDAGLMYEMGLGKYGGDYEDFDNEESGFSLGVGLEVFFK